MRGRARAGILSGRSHRSKPAARWGAAAPRHEGRKSERLSPRRGENVPPWSASPSREANQRPSVRPPSGFAELLASCASRYPYPRNLSCGGIFTVRGCSWQGELLSPQVLGKSTVTPSLLCEFGDFLQEAGGPGMSAEGGRPGATVPRGRWHGDGGPGSGAASPGAGEGCAGGRGVTVSHGHRATPSAKSLGHRSRWRSLASSGRSLIQGPLETVRTLSPLSPASGERGRG